MPCYHPLRAWQRGKEKPRFKMPTQVGFSFLQLPCGQCIGCRLEKSRQWAIRCLHESSLKERNSFVTLTYDDEHLSSMSLVYRDFQLFMKRLRKAVGEVRFYMCGEYGEKHSRPHFHALLFGIDFADKVYFKKLDSGSTIYTSKQLSSLWPHGYASVGRVNFESAAYVARYVMKKVSDGNDLHEILDPDTGEIFKRVKEMGHMSLKPGIGKEWIKKYQTDVYPHGQVVSRGVESMSPRYYDKLFELQDSIEYEALKARRRVAADLQFEEGSRARLAARETVAKAKVSLLVRSL